MTFRSAFITLATFGLVAVAPLSAQGGPGVCKPGEPGMARHLAPALKLTDEQKNRMETIRAKHAVELTAKRQSLREAMKAYHQACMDPGATPEQLKTLYQPVSERQFDLMLAQRALHLEQRAVLTPEQQAEADKLCHMGPGHGARGHHQGPGMGR